MAFEDDMIEAGYSDEQEYLDSLTKDDCLLIIKYGLRGDERAPIDVTVDDIKKAMSEFGILLIFVFKGVFLLKLLSS